ncbi:hypothetical protein ABZX40_22850 [Streptomyces sp. NPDC004610]|uniref:hypothetical protein n=1 Tax=unclassified Streptomyces TaxID=2593676 RepID=UPI00339FB577
MPEAPTGYRIFLLDEDPLRARREARELVAEVAAVDPGAATLDVPGDRAAAGGTDKGAPSLELVGVLISGGALAVACVQLWLSRVPQRTIVVRRADGAELRITGRQAREDDDRIDRFLAGGDTPTAG